MTHPSQANYLLVDGALRPGALAGLYQHHELFEIDPLYLGTRWQDLYDLGPILVKPLPDSSLLSEWLINESLWADSTLIYSPASIEQLAEHLRRFISPSECGAATGVLRFSDPLVAHFWLSSFSGPSDLHLGPIQHWWVAKPKQIWEPRTQPAWEVFSGHGAGELWDNRCALLAADQRDALAQTQYWQFTGRIHAWISQRNPSLFSGMSSSQVNDWLDSCLQAGRNWGLFTEQGLAIWVEACADDGQDFAIRPKSAFQNWLTLDPVNPRLSPEVRIEAFDVYRQAQEDNPHG